MNNPKHLTIFAVFVLAFAAFAGKAQNSRELVQEDDKNKSQKRVALVIGNGAYTKAKPLANPSNDAADMATALKALGFEVISGVDRNKRQMETLIREFGTKLAASGGVGLFYYAGHGLQVGGENFLVPVDADIPEEDEVAYSAVSINLVLSKMQTAKNDLNIIILDACRNNPFARSWRSFRDNSNTDGLAKISPPTGTLVLYATEPGKVASDGAGRNGLFTEALLKQIKRPDLEYDKMVKAVSTDVWQKSNRQQLPWKEGNTLQDFYFALRVEQQTDQVNKLPISQTPVKPQPEIEKKSEIKPKPVKPTGTISKIVLPGGIEMRFSYIQPGEFQMGSNASSYDKPVAVRLTRGFEMQVTEVTQAQWKALMGDLPSKCDSGSLSGNFVGDNKPVICVSWDDAQEFVNQMNLLNDGYLYRLPTEVEWEYTARAGTKEDVLKNPDKVAWISDNSGETTRDVATKQANAWGVYDMYGNVIEWCQDWFDKTTGGTLTDPTGPGSSPYNARVARGGSFSSFADWTWRRWGVTPSNRTNFYGFRLVRQ